MNVSEVLLYFLNLLRINHHGCFWETKRLLDDQLKFPFLISDLLLYSRHPAGLIHVAFAAKSVWIKKKSGLNHCVFENKWEIISLLNVTWFEKYLRRKNTPVYKSLSSLTSLLEHYENNKEKKIVIIFIKFSAAVTLCRPVACIHYTI